MTTPLSVDCQGRLYTADGDELLTPFQVARRFDVTREYPSRWARTFGHDHAHPYPTHVPDQHVLVEGKLRVRASAVDAWLHEVHPGGIRRGRRQEPAADLP